MKDPKPKPKPPIWPVPGILATVLRTARRAELAKRSGYHAESVSQWARGTSRPSLSAFIDLAGAAGFAVTLSKLSKLEDSPTKEYRVYRVEPGEGLTALVSEDGEVLAVLPWNGNRAHYVCAEIVGGWNGDRDRMASKEVNELPLHSRRYLERVREALVPIKKEGTL